VRILGVTQGSNLRVFLRLSEMLKAPLSLSEVSAYVADSQEFYALASQEAALADGTFPLLKEWEITGNGLRRQPDWAALGRWEAVLGDPVLWNALLADRRIFFGKRCKLRQDYGPRFSYIQMYGIIQEAIERIAGFLDTHRPDLILGFGTSTFGDYLLYRFAKAQGIAYLQLKATKIGNYVALNDDAIHLSHHIARRIDDPEGMPEAAVDIARRHLVRIRERGVRYEGALKSTTRLRPLRGIFGGIRGLARDLKNRLHPVVGQDNHVESAMFNALYGHILQPIRWMGVQLHLRGKLLGARDLVQLRPYTFFPLHFEPEVSLQVFGRPFQNQIELIRHLALSLPAGMQLVVKEHPRALGFRPSGYYRKLLEIPNVLMVDPLMSTHAVIGQAALVAVISGSTGLEAAVLGKPVVTFGIPTYGNLPSSMVRQVVSLHATASEIRDLLASYRLEEDALERFFAANVLGAVPVDLYSVLLAKTGRHNEGREGLSSEERRAQDYSALAEYCCSRIRDELARAERNGT